MILRVLELLISLILFLFASTQIIFPLIKNRALFPVLRPKLKSPEEQLEEAEQALQLAQQRRRILEASLAAAQVDEEALKLLDKPVDDASPKNEVQIERNRTA